MTLEEYSRVLRCLADAEVEACAKKLAKYGHAHENVFAILDGGAERSGTSIWQTLLTWMDRAMSIDVETSPEERLVLLKDLYGYCCLALALHRESHVNGNPAALRSRVRV